MKVKEKWSKSDRINSIIILAIVIVVAVSVVILVRNASGSKAPALQEGKDYDINLSNGNVYTIVDENGNTIELERISAEVFQDRHGRRYRFVSGSPFKYVGEE